MNDPYAFWKSALAGDKPAPSIDDPKPGFYRSRRRGAVPLPLAIWMAGDEVCGRLGDQDLTRDRLNEVWSYACENPITEEVYRAVAERGEVWPDMDATVTGQLAEQGHNRPPTSPEILLAEQIDNARAGANQYSKIESDDRASQAQSLRSRLLELGREADKHREAKVRPHLDETAAINKTWKPIIDAAKGAADQIKVALQDWEDHKRNLVRKAAEEAAAAARKAEAEGTPAPPPPAPTPPPAAQIGGAYGRRASVGVKNIIVVDDWALAFQAVKDDADVQALIQKKLQKIADAGIKVEGTHTVEKAKVK